MTTRREAGRCGILCVALIGFARFAGAEEAPPGASALQEIVVTANKRGAQSHLRPVFRDLERSGAQGVQDFAQSLPGLAVFGTGPNQQKIKIRGVSGSTESEPQETVGVYLDDVDITNPGGTNNENNTSPDLNLFDIERIEVLKGPQGTLYGAGSMGGSRGQGPGVLAGPGCHRLEFLSGHGRPGPAPARRFRGVDVLSHRQAGPHRRRP